MTDPVHDEGAAPQEDVEDPRHQPPLQGHRRRPQAGLRHTQTQRVIGCRRPNKASSYIAQYPVLRTAQSALHFTSLTDLFTQTPSRLLWEASSHMLQLMCEGCSTCSYTYPSLPIARYSFIQLSELEQCRVKKLAQEF